MVRAPRSLIDVVGLGILALGALLWFDTFPFDRGQEGARRPASAAGFDFDGKPVELSQWSGRILVVNFWATWCEPCRREVPDLVALQNEYPIATLVVVGIAVDSPRADVEAFVNKHAVPYPIVMATNELYRQFPPIHKLPSTFIVSPDGSIVLQFVGVLDMPVVRKELKTLIGGSTPEKE